MSKSLAKFGELSIRTTSSLEDDSIESDDHRFSTIDLNGGVTANNGTANMTAAGEGGAGNADILYSKNNFSNIDECNDSIYSGSGGGTYLSNGSMNGYTSFGESQSNGFAAKTNGGHMASVVKKFNGSSSLQYDDSFPSLADSVSNQNLKDSLTMYQVNFVLKAIRL